MRNTRARNYPSCAVIAAFFFFLNISATFPYSPEKWMLPERRWFLWLARTTGDCTTHFKLRLTCWEHAWSSLETQHGHESTTRRFNSTTIFQEIVNFHLDDFCFSCPKIQQMITWLCPAVCRLLSSWIFVRFESFFLISAITFLWLQTSELCAA